MANVNVNISFEAANVEEAEAKIASWTLHEGCRINSSVTQASEPAMTDEGGNIVPVPPPESVPQGPPPDRLSAESISE